jgi:hypothetical protein
MERAIGGRWARIKTAATAAARAVRAAMGLSPRTTDTTDDRTRHGAVSDLIAQTAGETLAKRQINHQDGNNKEEQGRKIVGLHIHPPQAQHLY